MSQVLFDKLQPFVQPLLPTHILSRLALWYYSIKWKKFKNWQIKRFIKKYQIDLSRLEVQDINAYPDFKSFFIRYLNANAMGDCAEDQIASPAEATVTIFGNIDKNTIFQAKNRRCNLAKLLGNEPQYEKYFANGAYMIFQLQPFNYHHFHMPLTGELKETLYIPGRLLGLEKDFQKIIPNLYAWNERYITLFDTEVGKMAIVLVGAFQVGSIQTAWMTEPIKYHTRLKEKHENILLNKKEELGFFQYGSTIILLFERNKLHWNTALTASNTVKVCESVGTIDDVSMGTLHKNMYANQKQI